jgi:uncharacterized SAM-binding protein YcdF (DUF218 family)
METWSISWAVRNLLSELLTPPGIWIVWVLLMLFLIKKHELIKKSLITVGLVMIWVTSTNYFAVHFTNIVGHWINWPPHITSTASYSNDLLNGNSENPQAIVILGGGRRKGALETPPDYQQQDLSSSSIERLRYGVRLARQTKLPILVTGGTPDKASKQELSEAFMMKLVLEQELSLSPQWLEDQSNTTQENAIRSAEILKKEGIKSIYLVTHFWHMPRAKAVFEKEGLNVIEASMGFYQKTAFNPLDFYPSSEGFQRTRWIWHEILGNLWYRVKFYNS